MGVLVRKQKGVLGLTQIAKLSSINFVVSLSMALINTIWAVYIYSFVGSSVVVGFISAFLTLLAFFSFFFFIPFIEKTSKSKMFSYALFLMAVTYLLFYLNSNFILFILLAIALTFLYSFKVISFGIIVKDKSAKTQLSRNEGVVYSFMNLAWVIGPLIAGLLAFKYSENFIFLIAAIFVFLSFILFKISKIRDSNIKKKIDKDVVKNFIDYFKNKDRLISYIISGGVNLWWVLIYLFIPIYIIENGLNDLWVGYFLFAVAIPLIISEYGFSKLAGKIGFKKIFKIGFLFVALISLICFFVTDIYAILILLSIASFGIAMVEPTTEAYFFDLLKGKQDNRFYGPYNTGIDVNQFIGKVLASCILLFFPFKSLFLLFSGFMFVMFLVSFKVREIIEKKN